jgi:molybdopterin converting factor small subunit
VLTLPKGASLPQLKTALIQRLKAEIPDFHHEALIELSAFATDQAILPKDTRFQESCNLSLLPPVCGG